MALNDVGFAYPLPAAPNQPGQHGMAAGLPGALGPKVLKNVTLRINELGFPILSDMHNEVAALFGLRFTLPDYLITLYKSWKNDLPAFNGDDSWTLPMPARYVIGSDGVILYAEINPDYTQRPEPQDMLAAFTA